MAHNSQEITDEERIDKMIGRLLYLKSEIEYERIAYSEIAEIQSLYEQFEKITPKEAL